MWGIDKVEKGGLHLESVKIGNSTEQLQQLLFLENGPVSFRGHVRHVERYLKIESFQHLVVAKIVCQTAEPNCNAMVSVERSPKRFTKLIHVDEDVISRDVPSVLKRNNNQFPRKLGINLAHPNIGPLGNSQGVLHGLPLKNRHEAQYYGDSSDPFRGTGGNFFWRSFFAATEPPPAIIGAIIGWCLLFVGFWISYHGFGLWFDGWFVIAGFVIGFGILLTHSGLSLIGYGDLWGIMHVF